MQAQKAKKKTIKKNAAKCPRKKQKSDKRLHGSLSIKMELDWMIPKSRAFEVS